MEIPLVETKQKMQMKTRYAPLTILLLSLPTLYGGDFSDTLWKANEDIYEAILVHPFLQELQTGKLDEDAFAFYIIQDLFYLREFAKSLEHAADKAPDDKWRELLNRHARETIRDERRLHESIFEEYGITAEQEAAVEPAPEAYAYTTFMIASTSQGTFAEAMATLLPCYWIYWEVGKQLSGTGSKNAVYQKWIDTYASDAYGNVVKEIIGIVDTVADEASQEERASMKALYRRGCRYEWMFWDSAYHRRPWPPPVDL